MEQSYEVNKTFDKINFEEIPLQKGEYENCTFNNCNFSNSNLSEIKFVDCIFNDCNLSNSKLMNTLFRDVKFKGCKMLGLGFDKCSDFGLSFIFDNCTLDHSTFFKKKIKQTLFRNSQLAETDFTDCDLSGSLFDNCVLTNARFEKTILEKADFSTSHHYSIDPEINKIKKAKFSLSQLPGLLEKYDIVIDKSN
jgi:fluoroquinolone resistance protein